MRKYYNRKKSSFKLETSHGGATHWDLYDAYISANVDAYPFLSPLLEAIRARDVEKVMALADTIGDPARLHQGSVSLKEARVRRQAAVFLKKFPFSAEESVHDRKANAILKWREAERKCAETNKRLRDMPLQALPSWLFRARGLIANVLGYLEPSLLMKIILMGKHGPGSTSSNTGGRVTPYYKYADFPYTVTSRAARYAYAAISSDPHWFEVLEASGRRSKIPNPDAPRFLRELALFQDCVEVVEPDMVTFVPKDYRTDRPIAVGNSLNLFLQLGVCQYMTRQLKEFGVDLTDQSRNQDLAQQGSRYAFLEGLENPSQFSTIDLASASDTISLEIVRLLLPSDWFTFLDDIRHQVGEVEGEIVSYEKFSAMGCGFTFPLESLIFWAVAKASAEQAGHQCKRSDIGVFGDDIIVRLHSVPAVVEALNWAGFLVNTEKSFTTGSFKESCGLDCYMGNDVRPFYLKREVCSHVDCYFICNSLSHRVLRGWHDRGLYAAYAAALSLVPLQDRLYRPIEEDLEAGLQVPLSFMRQHGLAPWLSPVELTNLRLRGFVSDGFRRGDSLTPQLSQPYAFAIRTQPKTYSGRGSVRMYMWLLARGLQSDLKIRPFRKDRTIHENMIELASASGVVTRRNAVQTHVTVSPVLNWNGDYTENRLGTHPIEWC